MALVLGNIQNKHLLAMCRSFFEQAHEILELIAYAKMTVINAHHGVSSGAGGPMFGLSLRLLPYFMYTRQWRYQRFYHVEAHKNGELRDI